MKIMSHNISHKDHTKNIHTRHVNARPLIARTGAALRFMLTGALLFAFIAGVSPARGSAQDRNLLNRLIQTPNASDAAVKAFQSGRDMIADEQWTNAQETFSAFVEKYPKDKNIDAAFYWLAYSFKNQNKCKEADVALKRLIRERPDSSWADDARAMLAEIAPCLGGAAQTVDPLRDANEKDAIKLIALQSLFTSAPDRALVYAAEILKPGSSASPRLKEGTITLLGHYGGKQATAVLIQMARSEPDIKLRRTAISMLGET